MTGNRIQGRYISLNTVTGQRTFGDWNVKRQREETTR
jgi:hypothetical protein